LVIDARSIEKLLKWGAVPLALVIALFVSRYSGELFGTGDTALNAVRAFQICRFNGPGLPSGAEQRPRQQGIFA
jgi:hypothetical protein